jgi:hypothetical protein
MTDDYDHKDNRFWSPPIEINTTISSKELSEPELINLSD